MPLSRTVVAVAVAATAATVGLAGCSHREPPALPADVPATTSAPTSTVRPGAPVPAADVLADVLYRLADPAIPSAEKVDLVNGATPDESAKLDRFTAALKDGGYLPLTFDVTDVGFSDRNPGDAAATVKVTTANPDTGEFTFPMEFTPRGDGWQLSQQTAGLLLSFGSARSGGTSPVAPPP